jgi:hypothetical protein
MIFVLRLRSRPGCACEGGGFFVVALLGDRLYLVGMAHESTQAH